MAKARVSFWRGAAIAAAGLAAVPAGAQVLGPDAPACSGGQGPAILATVTGLKDARGTIKLELYPANETDFLEDDKKLLAAGKVFRRITVAAPQGSVARMCIRVPRPGRYALFFGHDRDGKRKFDFWSDGAGFPGNRKIGRSRPKLSDALIQVGPGVTQTTIRAQYLRGLGGFGF
ncbi:DUF2141 domain-containing protein [Sphingomonas sp. RHCKR47]|uniref:DUF2141 domain-containing protein n=1 Tax=Sphingomonas citricola TaxID=2862498 RepID=UPI001C67EF8B|nr:DUF2141 domain-containing protein [Sphingomonas citricola]MBW6524175.1 DUF2141 domain-containing protein [Sphingomonas citricola]